MRHAVAAHDAADALSQLLAAVGTLRGVGPGLGAILGRLLGVADARCLDLLWHLPHAVIERRLQPGPATLGEGERVTLLVSVQRHQPGAAPGRGWRLRSAGARLPYKVRCSTGSAVVHLVFFQAREAYLRRILPEGEERVVSGALGRFGREWQIVHPELIALPDEFARAGPLQPLYPLTQGLGQRRLGRCIGEALTRLPELPEWQDPAWLARQRWPSFGGALRRLHQPDAPDDIRAELPARRRLAFDELLASQLALGLMRTHEQPRRGPQHCRRWPAAPRASCAPCPFV